MTRSNLDRLTVLGAGVLGGQIAWHSAFKGKTVVVYEPFPEAIVKATVAHDSYARIYAMELGASDATIAETRARLSYSRNLQSAVAEADLVIEAVPEVPEIKTRVYQDMAALLPPHTIVATNSSTLLPRDFAEATGRPAKYCALHFANLIWALNLVEIMAHPGTSRETLDRRHAVRHRDRPGADRGAEGAERVRAQHLVRRDADRGHFTGRQRRLDTGRRRSHLHDRQPRLRDGSVRPARHGRHEDRLRRFQLLGNAQQRCPDAEERCLREAAIPRQGPAGPDGRRGLLQVPEPRLRRARLPRGAGRVRGSGPRRPHRCCGPASRETPDRGDPACAAARARPARRRASP